MCKILVVDDESDICAILKYNLEKAGFNVDTADSAEDALSKDLSVYNLILLDIMMGKMSGLEMASKLRSEPSTKETPIIFITAKDTEDDVVEGFNVGADDYISKPFSVNELISRVKAVLRRCGAIGNSDVLKIEGLEVNLKSKKVKVDGEDVSMTKTEYEILCLLLKRPSFVFSREDILNTVWHDDVIVLDRTVDVNITRLRHKLGPYGQYIVTRHGYGYAFEMKD